MTFDGDVCSSDYGCCRERFVGPPHSTTPAAVIANENKTEIHKSREHINEKGDGPYRGFGYTNLFSDPIDLVAWSQRELL